MLAALGIIVVELQTGTNWFAAISGEWTQPSYIGLDLPWSQRVIVIANTLLVGTVEVLRNTELDPEVSRARQGRAAL